MAGKNYLALATFVQTNLRRQIVNHMAAPLSPGVYNTDVNFYYESCPGDDFIVFDLDGSKTKTDEDLDALRDLRDIIEVAARVVGGVIVQSKSGGDCDRHIYFSKHPRLKVRNRLSDQCEIKTRNNRITFPSEVNGYLLLHGDFQTVGQIPQNLKDMVHMKPSAKTLTLVPKPQKTTLPTSVTEKLNLLDPKKYGKDSFEDWFKLLGGFLRASEKEGIDGLPIFLAWCAKDEQYNTLEDSKKIQTIWASAKRNLSTITADYFTWIVERDSGLFNIDRELKKSDYTRSLLGYFLNLHFPNQFFFNQIDDALYYQSGKPAADRITAEAVNLSEHIRSAHGLTVDIPARTMVEAMRWWYELSASRHPLREWIQKESWDGVDRVYSFVDRYIKTKDSPEFSQAIFTLFLKGLVHRVFKPTSRFEYVIIFYGPQGRGKSSIGKVLANGDAFFNEGWSYKDKDDLIILNRNLIVELSEINDLSRFEKKALKRIVTRVWDEYRVPFKEGNVKHPRLGIMIATSNRQETLDDDENRRFLSASVEYFDEKKCGKEVGQIWAQLIEIYYENTSDSILLFPKEEFAKELKVMNFLTNYEDSWTSALRKAFHDPSSELSRSEKTCGYVRFSDCRDFLVGKLESQSSAWGRKDKNRLAESLTRLGFEEVFKFVGVVEERVWIRKGGERKGLYDGPDLPENLTVETPF